MTDETDRPTPYDFGWQDGTNDIHVGWNPSPEDYGFKRGSDEHDDYILGYREAQQGWDHF